MNGNGGDTLNVVMQAPGAPGAMQPKPTQPLPYMETDTRYYVLTRPGASMTRNDGLVCHFPGGVHETKNFYSIQWLDNEIANQHPELRAATEEEIKAYQFRKDPREYIRKETVAEVEESLSKRLAQKMAEKLGQGTEVAMSAEDILAMLRDAPVAEGVEDIQQQLASNLDAAKLAGTSASLQDRLNAIKGNGVTLMNMTNSAHSAN